MILFLICLVVGFVALVCLLNYMVEKEIIPILLFSVIVIICVFGGKVSFVLDYQNRLSRNSYVEFGQINYISENEIRIDNRRFNLEKEVNTNNLFVGDFVKFDYVTTDLNGSFVINIEEVTQ